MFDANDSQTTGCVENTLAAMRRDMELFLAQFRAEQILFVPNPGNAGDWLISSSTRTAMAKAFVNVEVAGRHPNFKNRTVFLGGGGNFIDLYTEMRKLLEACRMDADRIVLLPHTIRGNADILRTLDERVTVWCRERRSYDYVRDINPALDCRLGHDMAFHCDTAELLSDPYCIEKGLPFLTRCLSEAGISSLTKLTELPIVKFMRTDKEAGQSGLASDLDVSKIFESVAYQANDRIAAWCFLETISAARSVVTDRLHVAIACALLGKDCELLDNSYNKNREVFAYSLARIPHIKFGRPDQTVPDQPPVNDALTASIATRCNHSP